MNNWNTTKIEKETHEGATVYFNFEKLSNKSIKEFKPSCSCTSYSYDEGALKIMVETQLVSYTLPKALYQNGTKEYVKTSYIDVIYEDDATERLFTHLTVKEIPGRNGE